jgi:hypothetical protein
VNYVAVKKETDPLVSVGSRHLRMVFENPDYALYRVR